MKERIKYSGCVHVRGIFRRTWRPRHIEIDEEGIVRYFSSNSKERLDRALQLFSLPDFNRNDSQSENAVRTKLQEFHDEEESFHRERSLKELPHHIHDHRPKAIMTIVCARLIDEKSIRDMHIGLPQGTYGFVFTAKQFLNAPSSDDNAENFDESHHFNSSLDHDHFSISRDYLCSVSSLEEAKKWVKILNWASKVTRESSCDRNYDTSDLVVDNDENDSTEDAIITSFNTRVSKLEGNGDLSRSIMSYTIVSKVSGFKLGIEKWNRLIGIDCEFFFEIQLLLLDSKQLKNRKRKRPDHDKTGWEIKEYTIYRSFIEVKCLIEELQSSGYNTDFVQTNLGDCESLASSPEVQQAIVGRLIQRVTSDVSLCNSIEAKRFFALFNEQIDPRIAKNQYFVPFIGHNIFPQEMTKEVKVGKSIDDFVTEWLKDRKAESSNEFFVPLLFLLKNAYCEAICTTTILYVTKKTLSILSIYTSLSFQIRVDIFLIIIIGAFYEGHRQSISKKNDSNTDIQSGYDKHIRSDMISIHNEQCDIKHEIYMGEVGKYYDNDTCVIDEPLSSPLPSYPANHSCWSQPDDSIFRVRGASYLRDRVKQPSKSSPFKCRGVDMWLTDNPERNIARLPCVLGGKLNEEDTFLVNFLLPFGNFVTYFSVDRTNLSNSVAKVWDKFVHGDQQYRDARLKLLPIVLHGPWIVKRAVGPGSSPALLGQAIPLQYYFTPNQNNKKGVYEVDVIITASRIAKGILSVVKGHTKHLTIALGFIIEGTNEEELPETVLASCQIHSLHLERCMKLPTYWDDSSDDEEDEMVY